MQIDVDFVQRTLRALVRCESVNPAFRGADGQPGKGEAGIARLADQILRDIGLETTLFSEVPERPSVVGILRGRGGGRSLMLNGHLDTVGPGGMRQPWQPIVAKGRLHGRGAYDMKAGVAASLGTVKALAESTARLAGDVVIALVADEEDASRGTAEVLRQVKVDGAIVTEPTGTRLCCAHKGFSWIRVTTRGFACHGSDAEHGIDANLRMGRFLARLAELERELRRRDPHRLVGRPSLHAPLLQGGEGPSIYSPRCTLQLERRTLPGETAPEVLAEIQSLAAGLAEEIPPPELEVEEVLSRPPFEALEDSAVAAAVQNEIAREADRSPEVSGVPFWTDAALLQESGTDTVVFGPSGAGAHEDEEWVDLDSVESCARVLAQAVSIYCA